MGLHFVMDRPEGWSERAGWIGTATGDGNQTEVRDANSRAVSEAGSGRVVPFRPMGDGQVARDIGGGEHLQSERGRWVSCTGIADKAIAAYPHVWYDSGRTQDCAQVLGEDVKERTERGEPPSDEDAQRDGRINLTAGDWAEDVHKYRGEPQKLDRVGDEPLPVHMGRGRSCSLPKPSLWHRC